MKKCLFICLILVSAAIPMFSQGLYFDIGLGFGSATTEIDGVELDGSGLDELAIDLGLKLGYGPIGGVPLYLVGVIEGVAHRFSDDYNYIQFNSYLLGPGIILYPVSILQLSASAGYSYTGNQSDFAVMAESESGYAASVSAAFDFGKNKHGFLIGGRYFLSVNELETGSEQKMNMISLFFKYAYRTKKG